MVLESCIISFLCVELPFLGGFTRMHLILPQHLQIWNGIQLLYVSWWIVPSPVPYSTCWQVFSFSARGALLPGFNIPLLRLDHTLECKHGFLRDPLHPMDIDIFVYIVLQDLIAVLIDSIEYHYLFYTLI